MREIRTSMSVSITTCSLALGSLPWLSALSAGAAPKPDLRSEKVLLKWETQRRECCHHAGMMLFGPDGNLYASTRDNTHPSGDSHGYAPIDRRPKREPFSAEKSSANLDAILQGTSLTAH